MMIDFPDNFPSMEYMMGILHKTIEKSWKNDITTLDIKNWLSNFNGQLYKAGDEQKIALWLLCNYTFFSYDEVNYLCENLYKKFMHDLIEREGIPTKEIKGLLDKLLFAAIGSASESGGLLLYHFRQAANLSIKKFRYPTSFNSDDDSILVCIDDVTLSGGTATRNFYNNIKEQPHKHIYYLTIIASKEAVQKLEELGIIVVYCNLVDERNQCFNSKSMMFHKYPNLKSIAKEIMEHYGDQIKMDHADALGYKNGAYAFGFYYNTPNNSLPIFWSSTNWNPIFPRKEKIYDEKPINFESIKFI